MYAEREVPYVRQAADFSGTCGEGKKSEKLWKKFEKMLDKAELFGYNKEVAWCDALVIENWTTEISITELGRDTDCSVKESR